MCACGICEPPSSDVGGHTAVILGLVVVSLRGQLAKPGRFAVADSSGAPMRLRHRQGFIGDHRLQRGARVLLGGGDGGISYRAVGQPGGRITSTALTGGRGGLCLWAVSKSPA